MAPVTRIVLTGFMGAGKSTLGPLIAAELGWSFADLDAKLVEAEQTTIAELFARVGEAGFRTMEAAMLRQLLVRRKLVLALGGGALEGENTCSLLHGANETHILYLETPLEVALARCAAQAGAAERPILANRDRLAGRFADRQAQYRRAHQVIDTTYGEPREIVKQIRMSLPPLDVGDPDGAGNARQ